MRLLRESYELSDNSTALTPEDILTAHQARFIHTVLCTCDTPGDADLRRRFTIADYQDCAEDGMCCRWVFRYPGNQGSTNRT